MSDDWTEEPEPPEEKPEERLLKVLQGETIRFVLRREFIEELLERIRDIKSRPEDYSPKAPLYILQEVDACLTALVAKLKPRTRTGQQSDQ